MNRAIDPIFSEISFLRNQMTDFDFVVRAKQENMLEKLRFYISNGNIVQNKKNTKREDFQMSLKRFTKKFEAELMDNLNWELVYEESIGSNKKQKRELKNKKNCRQNLSSEQKNKDLSIFLSNNSLNLKRSLKVEKINHNNLNLNSIGKISEKKINNNSKSSSESSKKQSKSVLILDNEFFFSDIEGEMNQDCENESSNFLKDNKSENEEHISMNLNKAFFFEDSNEFEEKSQSRSKFLEKLIDFSVSQTKSIKKNFDEKEKIIFDKKSIEEEAKWKYLKEKLSKLKIQLEQVKENKKNETVCTSESLTSKKPINKKLSKAEEKQQIFEFRQQIDLEFERSLRVCKMEDLVLLNFLQKLNNQKLKLKNDNFLKEVKQFCEQYSILIQQKFDESDLVDLIFIFLEEYCME